MMLWKRAVAGTTMAAMLALAVPSPTMADGAASTRNILLGAGLATYLIIQHNRKVHERYAEDARRQAELQSENSNMQAAYNSERSAYKNALAEIVDLKREVAYQHSVIVGQRHQVASQAFVTQPRTRVEAASMGPSRQVAMTYYGWGTI
ncbi:MAG TPA: hypothetical protein VFO29_06215 [Candidatus Rubrimentiphilum sp.]|nr:hypothetical protein [Candidatus Rubrimentiphilum sp.]